jgi:hypothetical protein
MNEEKILNGEKIRFGKCSSWIPFSFIRDEDGNYIKDIKSYIFKYIDIYVY